MARPKGSRTKISGAGLLDLEPLAKDAIRAGLSPEQSISIRLEAAKIVSKYIYIENLAVTHNFEPLTEEFVDGIYSRNFPQTDQASAVN